MSKQETGGIVAYFGQDRTDSKVISRIEQLRRLGYEALGLTYQRIKFNKDHEPDWENVDLGVTADYAYSQRIKSLLGGALRLIRHRRRLAKVELVFARNIDMALLALFARLITGNRAPIAYEVLDVHRFFLGDRVQNRLFRSLERWVLKRCDALIVSSEGYIRNYFEPVQRFEGRWFLLENKVPLGTIRQRDPSSDQPSKEAGRPWVIGWCGTMRCVTSLDTLTEIARHNRDGVQIYMRGYPTETGLEAFEAKIASEPNMTYGGGYKAPDDLNDVYAGVDLNWAIELWDQSLGSKNSDWLLPNRFYEGGCLNVPMIALKGTETARRVEQLDAGWVLDDPLIETVSSFLETLTVEEYQEKRAKLRALPISTFWEIDELDHICNQLLTFTTPDQGIVVGA